jgi:hypothetical protein
MSRLLPAAIAACCALVAACDLGGSPQPSSLRIANFVPDAPAMDFCLKPIGDAAYTTPFAGNSGLAFPALSNRANVDAGTYSVRIVPGGSTNCNTSLNGLGDVSPIAPGRGAYTLAAIGRLTGAGQGSLAPIPTSTTPPPRRRDQASLCPRRAEVDTVDIGTISGSSFFPQVTNSPTPAPPTRRTSLSTADRTGQRPLAAVSPTG